MTRTTIIEEADFLLRHNGYNAFSFKDIADAVGIKTASIHYHFPTKADLGAAVLESHMQLLEQMKAEYSAKSPEACLDKFLSIYTHIRREDKVCIVGSLASDLNTVEDNMKAGLKAFALNFLDWVSGFLQQGKEDAVFSFHEPSRTKALMIISSMIAIVQLSRLTGEADFNTVKKAIRNDLLKK